jgi:predicted amidohydrolase
MVLSITLAQIESKIGDVQYNLKKHLMVLDNNDSDFIVFPELSLTGYILKDLVFEVHKKAERAVEEISMSYNKSTIIIGTIHEVRKGIFRNSAAIIIDGKINYISKYYLPTYGLFEEKRYFQPGDPKRELRIFNYKNVNFGVIICEDAWHPEPLEALARLGADLILIPSASPIRGLGKIIEIERQWSSLLVAHAIMNTVWIAFSNMVGNQEEEYFWGGSRIITPNGIEALIGKKLEEDIIKGNIDLEENKRARYFSGFKDHLNVFHEILKDL